MRNYPARSTPAGGRTSYRDNDCQSGWIGSDPASDDAGRTGCGGPQPVQLPDLGRPRNGDAVHRGHRFPSSTRGFGRGATDAVGRAYQHPFRQAAINRAAGRDPVRLARNVRLRSDCLRHLAFIGQGLGATRIPGGGWRFYSAGLAGEGGGPDRIQPACSAIHSSYLGALEETSCPRLISASSPY